MTDSTTYVPGYRHDLFVSYAWVDNQPPGGEERDPGWVHVLSDNLKTQLAGHLGRSDWSVIWIDRRIDRSRAITPEVEDAVRRSAMLLIVLSEGWLESPWCSHELKLFTEQHQQNGGINGRILVVHKSAIAVERRPDPIRDLIGFKFYQTERDGSERQLGFPLPILTNTADRDYFKRVDDLGRTIASRLRELRDQAGAALLRAPTPPGLKADLRHDHSQQAGSIGRSAQRGASFPRSPKRPVEHRSLTLELIRSADSYTAHYWLADRDCGLLQRPWSEAQALIQAVDATAGPQAPATGNLPPGDALFALLFGGETHWEPLFRALFGYPEHGTRPNPTRGGVHLRLCSQDPLLLSLPWTLLSWAGRRLIDVHWEITTGSDVEPLRDCVTVPTAEFLVVWPGITAAPAQKHQGKDQKPSPVAALIDELWPRSDGATRAARVVNNALDLDNALLGMRPHALYLRAAYATDADQPAIRLDTASGATTYPLARLIDRVRQMDPPPCALIIDLDGLPSPEIAAGLVLELGEQIPMVIWRRAGSRQNAAEQILLAGLRRWLGRGDEPVKALHDLLREQEPSAQGTDPACLAIHANYRTWQTSTHRTWHASPLPQLALDRDNQKALITRHLGELVRSPRLRVMAVIAYGSVENLLAELTEQLGYELDLTAADSAAIEWQRISLPDDRTDLEQRLGGHLSEVLGAGPDENLTQLLRRKGPRGMQPGVKGVLWLDWGTLDDSEPARAWLTSDQLEDWLRFCSNELATGCPDELHVVCFLGIELPKAKYAGLAGWFEGFRDESWSFLDRFRFLLLEPLGRVDAKHLWDYLADTDTGLDERSRRTLVQLIRKKTGGAFAATVRLLDEGRNGSWLALLQRLEAGQPSGKSKRRSRTL